jgi:BirA family biotin operon repressor/biotin-[acetyl-CoA-carboxylase] ligase
MAINWTLERVEESPSTNDDLMSRWRQNLLFEPVARLAIKQTAGKGRLGRTWLSQSGQTLTFSIAYPFQKNIAQLSGLSLACGLAIINGISNASGLSKDTLRNLGLRLKWPNDLLINHNKLAGMLIEGGQLKIGEPTWLIIGIGINLLPNVEIERTIERKMASLSEIELKENIDIDRLFLALIKELGECIELFEKNSFEKFKDEWNSWDAFYGQDCEIYQNSTLQKSGISQGVDALGQLLLKTSSSTEAIVSGDVSLKVAL